MRGLLAVLVLFISWQSLAIEARVLIDETSSSHLLIGEMRVRCINGKHHSCIGKSYLLNEGPWEIDRHYNKLRVRNKITKAQTVIRGQHFRITGTFNLGKKTLHRMEIHLGDKKTDWVAHFPIDQYLYGVMAAEVPVSWPVNALKAQAVASRTYFLFKKQERKNNHFDVRSDIMDQVFQLDGKKHRNILQAVDETHGEILTSNKTGKIFPAYFHSDCGGKTSSEKLVWRKPSSLNEGVKDPYCKTASKNNWSHIIDKDKLMSLLHRVFYLPSKVQLLSILPRIHEESRAHIVDFMFTGNIVKRIRANDLRRLLGFGKLRSTHFEVSQSWNDVVFMGRGFGHGVGMCQWGAQRWARKGKSYRSILKHYYPQASLKKWDTQSVRSQASF